MGVWGYVYLSPLKENMGDLVDPSWNLPTRASSYPKSFLKRFEVAKSLQKPSHEIRFFLLSQE